MFEYLMPALWMRSYPHTLIAQTLQACVAVQRAFAQLTGTFRGASRSPDTRAGTIRAIITIEAFGMPAIALNWDATAGPVVSPYSTFLALVWIRSRR